MTQMVRTLMAVLALATVLGFSVESQAVPNPATYLNPLNALYGQAYNCNVCHTNNAGPARNSYGLAFEGSAAATVQLRLQAIESLDSDGDTFTNLQELQAGSLPGNSASTPGAPPPPPLSMASWNDAWFQFNLKRTGQAATTGNFAPSPSLAKAFLHVGTLTDPDATPGTGDELFAGSSLFVETSPGVFEEWGPADLHAVGNSPTSLMVWMRFDLPDVNTGTGLRVDFSAVVKGVVRAGALASGSVKSVGGNVVDLDPARKLAAGLKFIGKKVPPPNPLP